MLWLCLRLPQLPLDALPPAPPGTALAVIEQGKVVLANAEAQRWGVAPGQSSQTAQSLCGELECRPRDACAEQQLLHNIALWAYRFSGHVSLCPPNALLLELSRSLRMFRKLDRLYRRFIAAFRRRRLEVHTAIADTPLAAELLSHDNPPLGTLVNADGQLTEDALRAALAALPVEVLPLARADIDTLCEMGLLRLGQLQSLPSRALRRRLDSRIGELLDILRGQRPDPRPAFHPAEEFASSRYFEGGLSQLEQLRFPIAALLGELQHYLRLRQQINRDLHWHFEYLDGHCEQWRQELSHRHFDKRSVLELVMLALAKRPLAGPVTGLSLQCRHFLPLENSASSFFNDAATRRQQQLPQLLDKLSLRLEQGEYSQYLPDDSYLPEHHQQRRTPQALLASLQDKRVTASLDGNAADETMPLRPSWLLEPAQPLYQRQGSLFWRGALQLLQGPERLDSHWWQGRQIRDYYIARHEDGRLCWLYQDCLERRWYLHGFFG